MCLCLVFYNLIDNKTNTNYEQVEIKNTHEEKHVAVLQKTKKANEGGKYIAV